jgi:hypothetical protein
MNTQLTCKDVGFTEKLNIPLYLNPDYHILLKRGNSYEKMLENYKRFPNQLLWVKEQQACYYVNPDGELYKLVFEKVEQ